MRQRLPRGISRLPSGRYRIRVHRDGRNWALSADNLREAERIRARLIAELDLGTWIDPSLGRVPCSEWFRDWLRTGARRPATDRQYESLWRLHAAERIGDRPLNSITPLDVQDILDAAMASGLSPATVGAIKRLLVAVFNSAVKARRIARSPADGATAPKVERVEQRFLTTEQLLLLADTIDPPYRALVLLGGFAGLRIGELAGLELRHLDLLRRRIRVEQQLTEGTGRLTVGPPKSEASRRTVAIGEPLTWALAEHIRLFRASAGQDEPLFTSPGGSPLSPSGFRRRAFSRAVVTAGLQPLRVHDLRHTSAALAIHSGVHIEVLRRRLGHSSITTTVGVYGHLFDGLDEDAATRQERALSVLMEVRNAGR